MRPTMAKIDLDALDNNIEILKECLNPNTPLMAIVKANAYGHGIVEISKAALESGALCLGVAIPEEGIILRRENIDCPILILGGILPDQIDLALEYDLSLTVFTREMAETIDKKAEEKGIKAKVHLKMDTGMGRIGVQSIEETIALARRIKELDNLYIEGMFTHFSTADDKDPDYTMSQMKIFNDRVKIIRDMGIHPKWVHSANTAATIKYPSSHYDLVRAGIGIYGYGADSNYQGHPNLKPILTWLTKVIYIKEVSRGHSISYGRAYIANRPRLVATLPIGYADGYNRLLSNRGWVLIRGTKAPILGNICMDQMMVDVTHIPNLMIGEEAIIIGSQGQETITADDLARLCNTIPYEILTNISPRVERVYLRSKD